MRVNCTACGQSADSAFESCQFCGATLPKHDLETMARRAKPPEKNDAAAEKELEYDDGDEAPVAPNERQKTMMMILALAGFGMVIVIVGWIGNAIVKGVTKVGEHEEVKKLERDVNDAWKKVPKRR